MTTFEIFVLVLSSVAMLGGVAAVAISISIYRKVLTVKTLDMRVELRKTVSDCHGYAEYLATFIPWARKTREGINFATNIYTKEYLQKWNVQADTDSSRVLNIRLNLPMVQDRFKTLTSMHLEEMLISTYGYRNELAVIKARYTDSYAEDDTIRRQHKTGTRAGLLKRQ